MKPRPRSLNLLTSTISDESAWPQLDVRRATFEAICSKEYQTSSEQINLLHWLQGTTKC